MSLAHVSVNTDGEVRNVTVFVRMADGALTAVSHVSVMVDHVITRLETAPVHLDTWVTHVTRVNMVALG